MSHVGIILFDKSLRDLLSFHVINHKVIDYVRKLDVLRDNSIKRLVSFGYDINNSCVRLFYNLYATYKRFQKVYKMLLIKEKVNMVI